MDRAIDLHNAALRTLMDEYGGHEIRNEGVSRGEEAGRGPRFGSRGLA